MKRKILSLLLLVSLLFSFAACGEQVPAERPSGSSGTTTPPSPDNPGTPGDGEEPGGGDETDPGGEETPSSFTVTVMLNGKPFSPTAVADPEKALKVRFTDGQSTYTETVGADGTATVAGLDGDYTVTLLNLPSKYTYNPNIHKASNERPNIQVDLYGIDKAIGDGTELYRCKKINKSGTYRAELLAPGQIIYYEYTPTKPGIYYVESMVDISADMYNPVLKVYTGTAVGAKYEQDEVNGGGAGGSYTKNFLYKIQVAEEYLGNSYTFAVRVEGKDAVYPTYVDFTVSYRGTYEEDFVSSNLILPEFDFEDAARFPDGYLAYLEANMTLFGAAQWVDAAERVDGKRVFNEDGYRLNPDDGFYHLYDPVKYGASGGFGPILYADIAIPHIFSIDGLGLNGIEYMGNKALTVSEGTENYKLFIEGFAGVTDLAAGHNFFCDALCSCRKDNANGGGCKESENCAQCLPTCRPVPDNAYGVKGYADYAVGGRAPVTEELKIFLQKFSESQRYFSDGNGWVESFGYTAFEDSQWLFPCGYYTD